MKTAMINLLRNGKAKYLPVLLCHVVPASLTPNRIRLAVLRLAGVRLGSASISPGLQAKNLNLQIGDQADIGTGCAFLGLARISIGANSIIGAKTLIDTRRISVSDKTLELHYPIELARGTIVPAGSIVRPAVDGNGTWDISVA